MKLTKNALIKCIVDDGLTVSQIGKKFGVAGSTIYAYMKEYKLDIEKLRKLREKKIYWALRTASYEEVARRFNAHIDFVKKLDKTMSKDLKAENSKYYNKRWAMQGWIGNLYWK